MSPQEEKEYGEAMADFAKIDIAQNKIISCYDRIGMIRTLKDKCDIAFNTEETDLRQEIAILETEIARLKNG